MDDVKIQMVSVSEIKPYENNPRKNDDAVDAVAKSIKSFGFKVPIILDKNMEIVSGHTRLKASQKLGMQRVPCILADDLTEEQVKAFRLADNKVAELSYWDFGKLDFELQGIVDFDMEDFGFEDSEIDEEALNEMFELVGDNEAHEKKAKKVKCPQCGCEFEIQ